VPKKSALEASGTPRRLDWDKKQSQKSKNKVVGSY
jgi:hypothetical protein